MEAERVSAVSPPEVVSDDCSWDCAGAPSGEAPLSVDDDGDGADADADAGAASWSADDGGEAVRCGDWYVGTGFLRMVPYQKLFHNELLKKMNVNAIKTNASSEFLLIMLRRLSKIFKVKVKI
jgi:hypothetical protein